MSFDNATLADRVVRDTLHTHAEELNLMELANLLEKAGDPAGLTASFMLRVQGYSDQAKQERSRSAAKSLYQSKDWALTRLYYALHDYAEILGIVWGWGTDPACPGFAHVLYADIPTGQVSFHSSVGGGLPAYAKPWDGSGDTRSRIARWAKQLIDDKASTGLPAALS